MASDDYNAERYDRQIRLWGTHGQNKCSSANVCVINANSLGTEILKGLCLAGIGSFTILDSHKLSCDDIGAIFVPQLSLNQNRGETVKRMLTDMNNDVIGNVYPLEKYLPHVSSDMDNTDESKRFDQADAEIGFWKQFNCILICGFIHIDQIVKLGEICWSLNIPLLICKTIGYFGSMKCQVREHITIETHPDDSLPNFCIDKPFDDLKQYFESADLENPNKATTYPHIVILYRYVKLWQTQNNLPEDVLPKTYQEKTVLKSMINKGMKDLLDIKKKSDELSDIASLQQVPFENFMQAVKSVNTCIKSSTEIPDSTKAIFNNPQVDESAMSSGNFWLIIRAIREFVYNHNQGILPVSAKMPDMISSSEEYAKLRNIYIKKADEDIERIFSILQKFTTFRTQDNNGTLYEDTKLICRNIRDLSVMGTSSLADEYNFKKSSTIRYKECMLDNEFVSIGLSLKALDAFFCNYGRLPGKQVELIETDVPKLKDCVALIAGNSPKKLRNLDQYLYEVSHCGGVELHCISAFLGGCIAQEVIKFITNQYIPIDDTLIYNAMQADTRCFKLSELYEPINSSE